MAKDLELDSETQALEEMYQACLVDARINDCTWIESAACLFDQRCLGTLRAYVVTKGVRAMGAPWPDDDKRPRVSP
jgi:hypothetical protein